MGQYILRRFLLIIPVLLALSFIVFVSIRLVPGDPARTLAGEGTSEEYVAEIRKELGLDQPVLTQYVRWLGQIAQGKMGRSSITRTPVWDEIKLRYPATMELAVAGVLAATLIGVTAGILAAVKPYSVVDYACMSGALFGVSMPMFWSGLMLMLVFSVSLGWLPAAGRGDLRNIIMPAICLGLFSGGMIARMTRSCMLEVLGSEYITTARAKGLVERVVIYRHALKNALIPIVTVVGLQAGFLLGGTVIVEAVFAWPGLGTLIVGAIGSRDYTMVQGALLLYGLSFALVNLAVDILCGFLDPRIRYV